MPTAKSKRLGRMFCRQKARSEALNEEEERLVLLGGGGVGNRWVKRSGTDEMEGASLHLELTHERAELQGAPTPRQMVGEQEVILRGGGGRKHTHHAWDRDDMNFF